MYGYIYLTTNNINGKRYIGKKVSESFVENYYGSGTYIRKALKKYGKTNFTVAIIEECNSREELNRKERFWIKRYNAVESKEFYNLAVGGEGFSKGMRFSDEHKQKLAEGKVGENNPNYQKKPNENQARGLEIGWHLPASEKHKKRLSEIRTGCEVSEETRKKLSEAGKGKRTINNGKITKRVNEHELEWYLSNGWVRGYVKN